LEAAELCFHAVSLTELEDGGGAVTKELCTDFGADFEPPILIVKGKAIGRNEGGISPHDYLQAAISFENEVIFDEIRGILGSRELDDLVKQDMVAPAVEALRE